MLKLAFVALIAASGVLTAFVFEAATATENALSLAAAARETGSPAVKERVLKRAAEGITTSWARPQLWHAGAAEALSAIQAARGDASGDSTFYRESIVAANRAVTLAPVQPNTWLRLAHFAQTGAPDALCDAPTCLERSWRSAPMISSEIGCFRLRLANAAGVLTGPEDERILWYARSGQGRAEIARCLDFLAPEERFHLLLRAQ